MNYGTLHEEIFAKWNINIRKNKSILKLKRVVLNHSIYKILQHRGDWMISFHHDQDLRTWVNHLDSGSLRSFPTVKRH